jgi:hypothetical protein
MVPRKDFYSDVQSVEELSCFCCTYSIIGLTTSEILAILFYF